MYGYAVNYSDGCMPDYIVHTMLQLVQACLIVCRPTHLVNLTIPAENIDMC